VRFEFAGPLRRHHPLYTKRNDVENEAIRELRKMHYLKIACPHKQGKTSFLNRICGKLERDKTFVRLSARVLDPSSEPAWYDSLCSRARDQLVKAGLDAASALPIPANHSGWESFLRQIERLGSCHGREIVLVIDDLRVAVGLPYAFEFLMQMFLFYTAPSVGSRHALTFVVAGAFDDLDFASPGFVTDPLECALPVQLRSFNDTEVADLIAKGPFRREHLQELAQQVHYWTGGQPYLTQILCSILPADATPADVGDCARSLRTEGDIRARIVQHIEGDPAVKSCFQSILDGDRVSYSRDLTEQRRLQQFGLIDREPAQKYWVISNPLYRYLFQARSQYDVFISYRHLGGRSHAEMIQKDLEDHGWKVFRDDKLGPGLYRPDLLRLIQSTPVFVPVLSQGTLDRRPAIDGRHDEDILRLEVGHALARTEHIIPALMDGFQFPPDEELGDIQGIRAHNGADFGQLELQRGLQRLRELVAAVVLPRHNK
jgi:hypothetical protein